MPPSTACCKAATIFCSNTSSLTITEMSAATKRPDRFAGLHFFNPVPVMKLVEVVRTISTSDETRGGRLRLREVARQGADPHARQLGFHRQPPAGALSARRRARPRGGRRQLGEDIDKGMELGCGHPMGPLKLLDFVGLDTTYAIAEIMFDEYREKRFAPPPLLKRMVLAGRYGKKSGRGFYEYGG